MFNKNVTDLIKTGNIIQARKMFEKNINQKWSSPEVIKKWQFQNNFGPYDKFANATDWKSYFIQHDGLHNVQDDVVFSILPKYICNVGCKVCYLNNYWMDKENQSKYLTNKIPDNLNNIFKHFNRINCIDDLLFLKNNCPEYYNWYKINSPNLEHNITDNGFFQQYDLLMNELSFKEIAYISFSDKILNIKSGVIIPKLKQNLINLNNKQSIRKINFIMTENYPTENPVIEELFFWIIQNLPETHVYFHTDLCADMDYVADLKLLYDYDLPSIYYQENDVNPPVICQILTETIQLRQLDFYSTLTGSCIENAKPFYNATNFNPEEFLVGLLKGKIKTYNFYKNSIQKKSNNRFYDYFSWVVDNVKVNDDFTFIPYMMLNPNTNMAKMLCENGWSLQPPGLLKTNHKPKSIIFT